MTKTFLRGIMALFILFGLAANTASAQVGARPADADRTSTMNDDVLTFAPTDLVVITMRALLRNDPKLLRDDSPWLPYTIEGNRFDFGVGTYVLPNACRYAGKSFRAFYQLKNLKYWNVIHGAYMTVNITDMKAPDEAALAGGGKYLLGGVCDETIRGGPGNDTMYGEGGNDTMYGEAGDDTMFGGPGDDTLYGGPDRDRLYGGPGKDRLYGGLGNDTFVLSSEAACAKQDCVTTIEDYSAGDIIEAKMPGKLSMRMFREDNYNNVEITINQGNTVVRAIVKRVKPTMLTIVR